MTDDTSDKSLPRVDFERANAPLTRAEAYLLISKIRRVMLALNSSILSNILGDAAAARSSALDASRISEEIEPLLQALVYLDEGNSDEP